MQVLLSADKAAGVKCIFPAGRGDPLPAVQVGQEATVRGVCTGHVGHVHLIRCELTR